MERETLAVEARDVIYSTAFLVPPCGSALQSDFNQKQCPTDKRSSYIWKQQSTHLIVKSSALLNLIWLSSFQYEVYANEYGMNSSYDISHSISNRVFLTIDSEGLLYHWVLITTTQNNRDCFSYSWYDSGKLFSNSSGKRRQTTVDYLHRQQSCANSRKDNL